MKRLALFAALLFLASACAQTRVPPPKTAEYYLQEGEDFFENELYEEAIAAWEKVRESYYSPELNILAELKIAEAHYLAEHYVEAAAAYEDFLKQHPDHERTPEVLYRLGMSYYNQILSPDRDQTATRNARVTFQSLLKKYPDHPQAEEVKVRAARCRDRLAAHEIYVGRFYLRYGHPEAAINRLEGGLERFPGYSEKDKAYFHLGQAYLETGQRERAVEAFNTLFKQFPDSEYITEGQKLLEEKF